MTDTLLESELFGHEKGVFTDAHEARAGKFELASSGTLFLDEIGELSRNSQAKLLRVLEEKVVVRVGGSQAIETDTRVIAATNRDLAEMVPRSDFSRRSFLPLECRHDCDAHAPRAIVRHCCPSSTFPVGILRGCWP